MNRWMRKDELRKKRKIAVVACFAENCFFKEKPVRTHRDELNESSNPKYRAEKSNFRPIRLCLLII
jgi:hypothetical protein